MRQALICAMALTIFGPAVRDARAGVFELRISAGATGYYIVDDAPKGDAAVYDIDSTPGIIEPGTYDFELKKAVRLKSLGGFELDTLVAWSYGDPDSATVDIQLTATALGATKETLLLKASATDLQLASPLGSLTAHIGGGSLSLPPNGVETISQTAAWDPDNVLFSFPAGNTIGPENPESTDFFVEETTLTGFSGSGPFSLSYQVSVTAQPGQDVYFDGYANGSSVPEPSSLVLCGVASGVGACVVQYRRWRGRRRVASAAE